MSDLHARIIAELDSYEAAIPQPGNLIDALRAVVERHAPEQHYTIGQDNRQRPSYLYCCRCKAKAPCPEIRLIANQLGLTQDQEQHREEDRRG